MPDDPVLGAWSRVPRSETNDAAVEPGQEMADANRLPVREDLAVILVPTRLFRLSTGIEPEKVGVARA